MIIIDGIDFFIYLRIIHFFLKFTPYLIDFDQDLEFITHWKKLLGFIFQLMKILLLPLTYTPVSFLNFIFEIKVSSNYKTSFLPQIRLLQLVTKNRVLLFLSFTTLQANTKVSKISPLSFMTLV